MPVMFYFEGEITTLPVLASELFWELNLLTHNDQIKSQHCKGSCQADGGCRIDGSFCWLTIDVTLNLTQMIITSCMVDYTHLASQSSRSVVQPRGREGWGLCDQVTADWMWPKPLFLLLNNKWQRELLSETNLLPTELHWCLLGGLHYVT